MIACHLVDGSDYFGLVQELAVVPQGPQPCTQITIINDQAVESPESLSVCLESFDPDVIIGLIGNANVTILDDSDGRPSPRLFVLPTYINLISNLSSFLT